MKKISLHYLLKKDRVRVYGVLEPGIPVEVCVAVYLVLAVDMEDTRRMESIHTHTWNTQEFLE